MIELNSLAVNTLVTPGYPATTLATCSAVCSVPATNAVIGNPSLLAADNA